MTSFIELALTIAIITFTIMLIIRIIKEFPPKSLVNKRINEAFETEKC